MTSNPRSHPGQEPAIETNNSLHKGILSNEFEELEEFAAPHSVSPAASPTASPTAHSNRFSWMSGNRGLAIGIGVGMLLTLVGGRLISNNPPAEVKAAPAQSKPAAGQSVTVAPVQQTTIRHRLEATGTVAAHDMLPILPQATGLQIQQVLVEEGDTVQAGQPLAILDSSVLQAQLQQAQADYTAAQAVVRQKQAALSQEQAKQAQASSNLQRYQNLAGQGAISQQDLESYSTTASTAQSSVQVAQANIGSANADLASKQAIIQKLQTQIAQTVVRAPADGVIAEKLAHVGDVTSGSNKLFSIIRNGSIELQVQLPAAQLAQVRVGAIARVTSDADARINVQGRIREVAPLVDAQTRQATVKIDLPSSALLHPGMFLRAAIETDAAPGLAIPAKAVLPQQSGGARVYVVDAEGTAHAKSVQLGDRQPGGNALIEVVDGLSASDRVVVAGAGYVKDGDRVTVVGN